MVKLPPVSEKEWNECNEYNRSILEEFLMNSPQLSDKTKKAYRSNLVIWFNWVKDNLKNKPQYEIKSIEYMRYQNWLMSLGHSSSDITNKRAAVSSLNNYIVLYYSDDYPTFKNFIVKGMPKPEPSFVNEKNPPTKEEFFHIVDVMKEREDWQKVAYLMYTFDTGCRRAESLQLLKDVVDYDPIIKERIFTNDDGTKDIKSIKYYQSNPTRCKGRGKTGKVRKLSFSEETMQAIKKWLEVRGNDDCPYVFVSKQSGKYRQLSESSLNKWAENVFSPILGRRFHPHILREAKATISVVEEGKNISAVQRLLGHESSQTTEIYVIADLDEELDELFI
ncbi:site-specific integrase [Anaerovoracaceae bacterium 41-7]